MHLKSMTEIVCSEPRDLELPEITQGLEHLDYVRSCAMRDYREFLQAYGDREEHPSDPLFHEKMSFIEEIDDLNKHIDDLRREACRKEMIRQTRGQVIARERGGCNVVILEDFR